MMKVVDPCTDRYNTADNSISVIAYRTILKILVIITEISIKEKLLLRSV
ncbi:unnamed protein product [marine sediment metagenome]|uniref:Uncharacterized protein n=1 Tax=marine sediment metagenome TaxID=412755 RepID=X1L014_9ZZZZ